MEEKKVLSDAQLKEIETDVSDQITRRKQSRGAAAAPLEFTFEDKYKLIEAALNKLKIQPSTVPAIELDPLWQKIDSMVGGRRRRRHTRRRRHSRRA